LDALTKFFGLTQSTPFPKIELREDLHYGTIYLLPPNLIILNKKAISIDRIYGESLGIHPRCYVREFAGQACRTRKLISDAVKKRANGWKKNEL
jgi:hypothetical protein